MTSSTVVVLWVSGLHLIVLKKTQVPIKRLINNNAKYDITHCLLVLSVLFQLQKCNSEWGSECFLLAPAFFFAVKSFSP